MQEQNDLHAGVTGTEGALPWWRRDAAELLELMAGRDSAFVYRLDVARKAARRLHGLRSISRVFYAIKANDHPALLGALAEAGCGFECVSWNEVRHVLENVPGVQEQDLLFTPNFAPRAEYEAALKSGVQLTVDNAWVVHNWPGLFAGKSLFLRLDLEAGHGHHKKVVTAGADSKFGISLRDIDAVMEALNAQGAAVTGLHTHTGSGVTDVDVWREQLERFVSVLPKFPDARVLDLGGGLGVPDRPEKAALDLERFDDLLERTLGDIDVGLWLEPGRYLASECGVLLARVTQLKSKGDYNYLGIATGMNSLIRPALYGAYHHIVNLDRLEEEASMTYQVVGPICESGDIVGADRRLPACKEGDVMLVTNAGAYGRVMSSSYNRRQPAEEIII